MTRISFILILISFSLNLYSQEKPVGDEIWQEYGLSWEFIKDFDVSLNYEKRRETSGKLRKTDLLDLGLSYRLNKRFSFKAGIRNRSKEDRNDIEWIIASYFKCKYERAEFAARIRFHRKYEKDDTPNNYIRLKLSSAYNFSKNLSVQVQSELFYLSFSGGTDKFDKLRSGIEFDYEIIKGLSFSGYWLYEDEFNVKKPQDTRIFGFGIKYKI